MGFSWYSFIIMLPITTSDIPYANGRSCRISCWLSRCTRENENAKNCACSPSCGDSCSSCGCSTAPSYAPPFSTRVLGALFFCFWLHSFPSPQGGILGPRPYLKNLPWSSRCSHSCGSLCPDPPFSGRGVPHRRTLFWICRDAYKFCNTVIKK